MTRQRFPNLQLRALLHEAGWTQEALARAVNSTGAEIGASLRYDRTAVAHWLSGTRPRPPVPQLAAEALTRRLGRVVTPQAAGFGPEADAPEPGRPLGDAVAWVHRDVDAARRGTLPQRPYRMADAVHGVLLGVPVDASPAPETGAAAALHDAARSFAASLDQHGGRPARTTLACYLADDVFPRLAACRSEPARRELAVGASRLTFLLARMFQDGRLHGLAQRYYLAAHHLAAESRDGSEVALVLRAMSAQAERLGHVAPALQLAQAAVPAVRRAGPGRRAYVQAQLAVVLARCGDRRGAVAALTAAERATERAASSAPFESYPEAALHFQAAMTLEALGDLDGALIALGRCTASRSAHNVRGQCLSQAQRGQLLLRAGRLDEACAAWQRFLDGRQRLRSAEAERAVRDMRAALLPFRNRRGVAGLLERSAHAR